MGSDGELDLGAVEGVGDQSTVGALHVERVDDLFAERLHGGVADVEAELGERLGDAVQHADVVRRPHLDHRRDVRLVVVERHRRRAGRLGLQRPAPSVGAGPLGEPGLDRQLAGEGPPQVGEHGLPGHPAPRRYDAELRCGHRWASQLARVGPRRKDVETAQRQDAGDAGERPRGVGAHDGDPLGADTLAARRLAIVGLGAHVEDARGHRRERRRVGELARRGLSEVGRRRARGGCARPGRRRAGPSTNPTPTGRWPTSRPR